MTGLAQYSLNTKRFMIRWYWRTSSFCDAAFCVNTMSIPGFKDWTKEFDYGGGNTVFNATSLDDIGEHEIKHIARLYNIAPQIDEFTQSQLMSW